MHLKPQVFIFELSYVVPVVLIRLDSKYYRLMYAVLVLKVGHTVFNLFADTSFLLCDKLLAIPFRSHNDIREYP